LREVIGDLVYTSMRFVKCVGLTPFVLYLRILPSLRKASIQAS